MLSTLRHSPLATRHEAADAKLVPFAGWEMPVRYPAGIRAEHRLVRSAVGVFDVSHMGQIETTGPQALGLLQRVLSNDVARIPVGGAQYSVVCRPDGGVLDDVFTYRLAEDHFLTVTNAANHDRDMRWLAAHAGEQDAVEVCDAAGRYAMLAVQGPRARNVVGGLSTQPLPERMRVARRQIAGAAALVCGTGYTGEDGVELLVAPADAGAVWDALLAAGAHPAGLGARDTLRLEACFHLYGQDLGEDRGPIEAGLGWCCKEETGFVGAEAVAADRRDGTTQKLVPLRLLDPGIPRPGNQVVGGGVVTSGSLSPCLDVGIALAYLPVAQAAPGTEVEIDVRGRRRRARVARRPLFPPAD